MAPALPVESLLSEPPGKSQKGSQAQVIHLPPFSMEAQRPQETTWVSSGVLFNFLWSYHHIWCRSESDTTERLPFLSPEELPNPGIETWSPALQADSLLLYHHLGSPGTNKSQYLVVKIKLVAQWCLTLRGPMDCSPPRLLCPWNFPGKNTRVGCHFLLQGIFPTQGLNPGLPHCRQML